MQIRAGYFNKDCVIVRGADGNPKGFAVDILDHIAESEGWDIQYVWGTLPECMEKLSDRQIDLVVVLGYTEKRDRIYDFSKEELLTSWGRVFAHDKTQIQSILDLEGKSIGYINNSFFFPAFQNLLDQFSLRCDFVEYNSYDDMFKELSRGNIDGGIGDRLHAFSISSDIRIEPSHVVFSPFALRVVVPDGDPSGYLATIDTHLRNLKNDGSSYYYSAYETWFSGNTTQTLPRWLLWAVLGLCGLLIVLGFNAVALRKRIRNRTRQLLESRENFRTTLNSIGDAVIATDCNGIITGINPHADALSFCADKEKIGKPLSDVFRIVDEKTREHSIDPVAKVILNGSAPGPDGDIVVITRDGTEHFISENGAPILDRKGEIVGVVLVFRDVTNERNMQDEILKFKKLESVGVLAGGIAHDFNNILLAILGNIELATACLDEESETRALLDDAVKAAERAKDLTRQLLTFSKGGAPVRKPESINDTVIETSEFITTASGIRCVFDIPDDLWLANIDKYQIGQVVQNIVINAKQAMPDGGTITIAARNISENAAIQLNLITGKYILVTIADEGTGIESKNLSVIFDPYFTTKHGGSGLGLAVSHSIIRNHEGYLRVDSTPGTGTTFSVYLPAVGENDVPRIRSEKRPRSKNGTILLMDDEESILGVGKRMLVRLGYEVITARCGEEAITLYKDAFDSERPIDVVILDQKVPGGMSGDTAITHLLEFDPACVAVISSGYSNTPIMAHYEQYGFKSVLTKPYRMNDLKTVVAGALRSRAPAVH